MRYIGIPELLVLIVVAVMLFGGKKIPDLAKGLGEAISNFKGGGPGSPSHPIPGDDSRFLTRKRKQPDQGAD